MSPAESDPAHDERRDPSRSAADRVDRTPTDEPAAARAGERPASVPLVGADQPAAAWVRRSAASSQVAAGWQFGITLLLFAFGGWAADRWLGTTPWLLILGCLLGFAGALYSLVRRVPLSTPRYRPPKA